MSAIVFVAPIVMVVGATTLKHYCTLWSSKMGRRSILLKRVTQTAKKSKKGFQISTRLANASNESFQSSTAFMNAARQARDEGNFFQHAVLTLCGRLLLYRAGWLLGRAMQTGKRAEVRLKESQTIMNFVKEHYPA